MLILVPTADPGYFDTDVVYLTQKTKGLGSTAGKLVIGLEVSILPFI